jgi:hypothetical protein
LVASEANTILLPSALNEGDPLLPLPCPPPVATLTRLTAPVAAWAGVPILRKTNPLAAQQAVIR